MSALVSLKNIIPTVCIGEERGKLVQKVQVVLDNRGAAVPVQITIISKEINSCLSISYVPKGESSHNIFIDEISETQDIEVFLRHNTSVIDKKRIRWNPPKHWVVHLIHTSHHDIGYTDLASNIVPLQVQNLQEALEMASETDGYPADARFRIVIEQFWSALALMRSSAKLKEPLLERIRSGRFEVTALFANMITEVCGHESLIRALYPAFALKRNYAIPIITAEHNDIPGFSWGLSQVLTDAGIKLFCPSIPRYYEWGDFPMPSFWDDTVMHLGELPGIFWWEAPSSRRILFWSASLSSVGGQVRPDFSFLAEKLRDFEQKGYPYSCIRWRLRGGMGDNSPYLLDYSDAIRNWNERWRYPRLIFSTNTGFYRDLVKELPHNLPVFRGELPGQDYPAGTTSTALPTGVNRNNHARLMNAERLAMLSTLHGAKYPAEKIVQAYEDVLLYDEHTWGYHFPCGPAVAAFESEKAAHAFRAAANAQDVTDKAVTYIADHIDFSTTNLKGRKLVGKSNLLKEGCVALLVFNTGSNEKTAPVVTPMRAVDCCAIVMHRIPAEKDPKGYGYLKGMLLGHRWHENPSEKLVYGNFDLMDAQSGKRSAFQLISRNETDTVFYAAQRYGIGSGKGAFGTSVTPEGFKKDLCFLAENVPPMGYKTYFLVQNQKRASSVKDGFSSHASCQTPQEGPNQNITSLCIENEYYKITADNTSREIVSVYDKEASLELLDKDAPHSFFSLIVKSPLEEGESCLEIESLYQKESGPVCRSLERSGKSLGHPAVRQSIRLYTGLKEIRCSTRILKDATPLLDAHLAFPFKASQPKFRYEGCLAALNPIADYFPGAYSDTIAVQNWITVRDNGYTILWSSLDAPVVRISELWQGNVSPAHRCIISEEDVHPPLTESDLSHGWIYSSIFHNNFVTNFSISQVGDMLFRYTISSASHPVDDAEAAGFGWDAVLPFECIFTKGGLSPRLSVEGKFLDISNQQVILLAFKKGEDGKSLVLRLWNLSDRNEDTNIRIPWLNIYAANLVNLVEEFVEPLKITDRKTITINIKAKALATVAIAYEKN